MRAASIIHWKSFLQPALLNRSGSAPSPQLENRRRRRDIWSDAVNWFYVNHWNQSHRSVEFTQHGATFFFPRRSEHNLRRYFIAIHKLGRKPGFLCDKTSKQEENSSSCVKTTLLIKHRWRFYTEEGVILWKIIKTGRTSGFCIKMRLFIKNLCGLHAVNGVVSWKKG